jgi:hypothetical protein
MATIKPIKYTLPQALNSKQCKKKKKKKKKSQLDA